MGAFGRVGWGTMTSAGLVRVALAAALFPVLVWVLPAAGGPAFLAAVLSLVFGALLACGRPRVLARRPLVVVVADSLLVGLLVAGTGGEGSPFFPLYLLAALGVAGVPGPAGVAVATVVLSAGYPAAAAFAAGAEALGRVQVLLGAGAVALACVGAARLGSGVRGLDGCNRALSSALDAERGRAARARGMISAFGAALENASLEEILSWTARSARAGCGAAYAHVAALDGDGHDSVLDAKVDACPSWWHPSVQDLLLRVRREGGAVRSDQEIHGIEGFLAVPVDLEGGERWGAVIVGGGEFGAEEERMLRLICAAAGRALGGAAEAPGGRDPVSGLPNRASLHRVLRRDLSGGRALTVFAVGLEGLDRYNRTRGFAAGDGILRRVGGRLGGGRRAFSHGGDEFVVVMGGTDETRARRVALAIRQAASDAAGDLRVAVGFVHAGPGPASPGPILETALRALREARGAKDGVAGFPAPVEISGGGQTAEVVEALVGALEAKDPGIGEHLRSVSRIARSIARQVGLPEEQIEDLAAGALLHDVGKIGVSDRILHKPGRLTEEEHETITRHPELGVEILSPIKELAPALPVIRHHHERFDGDGYPDGLRGDEIPLAARIVAVADTFDAMTRDRPYGYGVSREAALREVLNNSGTQFDPGISGALRTIVEGTDERRADSAV